MIKDGFLIFQSILRERKIPRQQFCILHVFVSTRGVERNLDYADIHKAFANSLHRGRHKG